MRNEIPLIIRDDKFTKHVFIQINEKNQSTSVFSNFSSWENLSLIMEALAVTAEKCVKDGLGRKTVYKAIKAYLVKVLGDYIIK